MACKKPNGSRTLTFLVECGALSPLWTTDCSGVADWVQKASEHNVAVVASASGQSGDESPHSKKVQTPTGIEVMT